VPVAIIAIPACLIWGLVILIKCSYLFICRRSMEARNSLECFWKNSLTLFLLPWRVRTFLSPAGRIVAGSANYVDLTNVDITKRENIPKEFTPERVSLISEAADLYEHIWARGDGAWPVMDGAVCYETNRSFTPSEAVAAGIIDPNPGDPRPIRPVIVGFGGTTGVGDSVECAFNLLGGKMERFNACEDFVARVQAECDQKNAALTECRYIPVLAGHSMGGMIALAIAVKRGISSITFNSMGVGSGSRDTIGEAAFLVADTTAVSYHLNLSFEGDWVSGPNSLISQRLLGKTVYCPNCTDITDSATLHQRPKETWRALCAKAGLPHGSN
jgi:hypothetical protein